MWLCFNGSILFPSDFLLQGLYNAGERRPVKATRSDWSGEKGENEEVGVRDTRLLTLSPEPAPLQAFSHCWVTSPTVTPPNSPAPVYPCCRYETLAVATEAETRQDPDQPIKTGGKRLAVSPQGSRGTCTTEAGRNTREKMTLHIRTSGRTQSS